MSALELQKCIYGLPIEDQFNLVRWVTSDLAPEVELAMFDRNLAAGRYDEMIRQARAEREAESVSTELR